MSKKNKKISLKDTFLIKLRNQSVYISGAITGIKNLNKPKFELFEKKLHRLGYKPVNPHKLHGSKTKTWEEYMRTDIAALTKCGAIIMIPGWEKSSGAVFEFLTSLILDIPVFDHNLRVLNNVNENLHEKTILKILQKCQDSWEFNLQEEKLFIKQLKKQ